MESYYEREKSKHPLLAFNLNNHSMCELYQFEKRVEVNVLMWDSKLIGVSSILRLI